MRGRYLTRANENILDLVAVSLMVVSAVPIILIFNVRPLVSTVYFFILPSLYLILRKPKNLLRCVVGAVLIGGVLGFSLDFLAIVNNAWADGDGQLMFGYIFHVVPIDHMIWFIFWAFLIIVFYEHFLEKENSNTLSSNIFVSAAPAIVSALVIPGIHSLRPHYLQFQYAYLVLGFLATLPLLAVTYIKPRLAVKFLKVTPFFIVVFLSFELTAVYLNQWYFPGQYIGSISFLNLTFPIEEFIIWIVASSAVVLADYEIAVDDFR